MIITNAKKKNRVLRKRNFREHQTASLTLRARKLSEWNPILGSLCNEQATWNFRVLFTGIRHCHIKDLPVIKIKFLKNASTNTNFSFSSWVLGNNIFLQGFWKRTNKNDSRTNSVFILFYFFTFFSCDVIECQ